MRYSTSTIILAVLGIPDVIIIGTKIECCYFLCRKKKFFILNCIFIFYMQVGPTGKVVGIDHIAELVQASVKNVQADELELLTSGRVKLVGETLKNGIEWYA